MCYRCKPVWHAHTRRWASQGWGAAVRPGHSTVLLSATAACALVLALSGCAGTLVGDWHMTQAVPSKEVFSIDDAHFHRDGSFAAVTTIEGKTAREIGTYEFNGFKLTLRPQAGGQRTYDAMLKLGNLEVTNGNRKVILARGSKKAKE